MVEETNSQVNNSVVEPVDDGYEYEYIELAEGEELPEDAEYEYEYVEVPVDENGQVIENIETFNENQNVDFQQETFSENNSKDQIPQFLQGNRNEPSDVSENEGVLSNDAEPHMEMSNSVSDWNDNGVEPKFEVQKDKSVVEEDAKIPDFLQETADTVNIDDILDDDTPLQNVNQLVENDASDDDFEKELFGTPAPDLHLEEIEESELNLDKVSYAEEPEVAPEPVVEQVAMPEPEVAPEPVVEQVAMPEPEVAPEPVVEQVAMPEPEVAPELVVEQVAMPEPEVAPEPVVEQVTMQEPEVAPEPVVEQVAMPEPEVAPEPEVEQVAMQEPEVVVREEILSPEKNMPQSQDYQVLPKEGEVRKANVSEQVSVSGLEEEDVPVISQPVVLSHPQEKTVSSTFQQTEEIPVEVSVLDITDEQCLALCAVAFPFNKNSGFRGFQADEKVYNLLLDDVDYNNHEENDWSLIIFDDYRVRLNPNEKELVLPKGDSVVRYAKIMKSGKTKLELFNEEKYNFMAPTEEFMKIRGHYIYGNIANNSKLIVKDFVNISLADKQGKQITFNKPVSGLLTGPKAAKLYFSDVKAVIVPSAKQMHQDEAKERAKAARWYSGSSDDKCFIFDAKSLATEFNGNDDCKIIHVNVGISHYGWNITFNNGLFMSFRDLLEYQTRYGQLPDHTGVITHGQQTLKFSNVEKIVIYEAAQYFTYA